MSQPLKNIIWGKIWGSRKVSKTLTRNDHVLIMITKVI